MISKEEIRAQAIALGACRCGFAKAGVVDVAAQAVYDRWIAGSRNGTMDYCARYSDVRSDPRLLLDGAATVISCAFAYPGGNVSSLISDYALGDDYHYVVKDRLARLADYIVSRHGGAARALVDTAPMRERYWAAKAGVGIIGTNGLLIVPGIGSQVFLGELLWTGAIEPDQPLAGDCGQCMACVKACPGKALDGHGGCDARRCLSYLTIEYRGELDSLPAGVKIYGCDACQLACPHNAGAAERHQADMQPVGSLAASLPEFAPNPEIASLTADDIEQMSPSHYRRLTRHSAMRRVPLAQLRRNLKKNY